MIYSATVSQLMNSVENHSLHGGLDSIGTQSIASSSHSSVASCKSISDPAVLFSKAVLDLKRAAREATVSTEEQLTEYWDTWNYWRKHPFAIGDNLLSGKLLLEHLLVLTNLKYEKTDGIFESVKEWLQATCTSESNNLDSITQLRDQLCAGFFLIFCTNFQVACAHLQEVKEVLVPEYFEALKGELERREEQAKRAEVTIPRRNILAKASDFVTRFLLFLKEIALHLLDQMKSKHALLVAIIKSNSANFWAFCRKLLQILLSKF